RADEVEHGGTENGEAGRERSCRDARGDGVGRVVKAVREVEEECDRDDEYERDVHQTFLTTTLPTRSAAVSQASIASSSASKMSFQRMIVRGSTPSSSNKAAMASRTIRSPSSSSRLTSTTCGPTRRRCRSSERAFERCSHASTSTRHCSTACSIGASTLYRPRRSEAFSM